jgi:hypothetical protein
VLLFTYTECRRREYALLVHSVGEHRHNILTKGPILEENEMYVDQGVDG